MAPLTNLVACLGEPPIPNWEDEAGFLGEWDKVHWRDQAALGVTPPDERLKANDLPRGELDFGLVMENKLALVDSLPQVLTARPDLRLRCDHGRGATRSSWLLAK